MDPLKVLLDQKKQIRKQLKKDLKNAENQRKIDLESHLSEIDEFLDRFKVSKMQPRYVEGVLINYKLYQQIMKKLKGMEVSQFVVGGYLSIIYKHGKGHGTYTLMGLSGFFPKDAPFPSVELESR